VSVHALCFTYWSRTIDFFFVSFFLTDEYGRKRVTPKTSKQIQTHIYTRTVPSCFTYWSRTIHVYWRERKRGCFNYILVQTNDFGLHSRRRPCIDGYELWIFHYSEKIVWNWGSSSFALSLSRISSGGWWSFVIVTRDYIKLLYMIKFTCLVNHCVHTTNGLGRRA